ncbi:MAG TPA: glycosyltransferase family 39 protein [Terriglobales bacterium]|nr:glycosyltransferase family 39 protein [Terriglobales bacterium]
MRARTEILLLIACCAFLLFYGLGAFGLLGADEPRYAQVAREMLDRGDLITPTLNGKPWLEKPPLYYWQAMLTYRVGRAFLPATGVTEKCARLPGAIDAALMIAFIYFFLGRFRAGTELDAALIAAGSAGIIGFAHAASTDMPLTATFTIALLAWYAWSENQRKTDLAIFYGAIALGMLAKGPIAPALAVVIVILFAIVRRDSKLLLRTFWLPGIALFLAVALPWYILVQLRNPDFFRVFILEHNLARFSTNVYHHPQPFWFYLPVFLLAAMPWTLWLILAIAERLRLIWREKREAFSSPDDSWVLFLLLWMIVPILFFSLSQSKLPGYILPGVPAAALLIAEHLADRRERQPRVPFRLAVLHAILCGGLIFAALSAARIAYTHRLTMTPETLFTAAISLALTIGIAATLIMPSRPQMLRQVTILSIILSVATVIRFAAPAIDATQSSRPIAATIENFSREPVPVALYHVGRTTQYGLDFYLDRATQTYENNEIPSQPHLLVAAANTGTEFATLIPGRKVSYLTSLPARKLELYWIGVK